MWVYTCVSVYAQVLPVYSITETLRSPERINFRIYTRIYFHITQLREDSLEQINHLSVDLNVTGLLESRSLGPCLPAFSS